ncbi:hypothetical protein GOM49_03355 [Clostridium bovifaecis]|uniref:Restriction endonuclease type IV Mrr domain-containing protein n=1 Tax=Clostridium bovifaecis TaxID=2184719 RepID=A0A6I6EKT0_9CLOT|nr:hypothetical protein GOM49_03355 [Clostridium bovifaecis]
MIYNYLLELTKIISNFISTILLIFICISAIQLVYKLIGLIKLYHSEYKNIQRLKEGILTTTDLLNLSPKEFGHWAASFLEKQSFTDIVAASDGSDGGKDIICIRNDETYYVKCKGCSQYNFVDIEATRRLLGTMEIDGVKNGIIITTGMVTEKAINYIYSLPKPYSIIVYDGKSLINEYNILANSSVVNA